MKLRFRAVNDMKVDLGRRTWHVRGPDPQILLAPPGGGRIGPGTYVLTAAPAEKFDRLIRPSLYADTGRGFNEAERQLIHFSPQDRGRSRALVRFDRWVSRLRFDPCEAEHPSFQLSTMSLERKTGSPARPRLLLNLFRLLPDAGGAGGAGRVAGAMLAHLPKHLDLTAAIAPSASDLGARFPDVVFSIVANDDNASLAPLLAECDCYLDPLNGLRPTVIDEAVAVIALIHDLQHLRCPQYFSAPAIRSRNLEYSYAIERADRLVAISEYERHNLLEFYGADHVAVVPWTGFMAEESGLNEQQIEHRRAQPSSAADYLLYPAVPWPHKNHGSLLQAIGILHRRNVSIPLVLTNTAGHAAAREELEQLSRDLGIDRLVACEGFLPEGELLSLLLRCRGLVFPSLYEGFGIPLVDAMKLQVPVLASRSTAIPEVCGDAAWYFQNPRNALSMADDIEAFWCGAEARSASAAAGYRHAQRFSAALMTARLLETIKDAVASKNEPRKRPTLAASPVVSFRKLSVFILYADLSDTAREQLSRIDDIEAFHAAHFGRDSDVTVGLELHLADDARLRRLFKPARKLLCFAGDGSGAVDRAVVDFDTRFNESEMQMVTRFGGPALDRYRPHDLAAAVMALTLHDDADVATFDDGLTDCRLDAPLGQRDAISAFDRASRGDKFIADVLLKRSSMKELKNGTSALLAAFHATFRGLRVPRSRRYGSMTERDPQRPVAGHDRNSSLAMR